MSRTDAGEGEAVIAFRTHRLDHGRGEARIFRDKIEKAPHAQNAGIVTG